MFGIFDEYGKNPRQYIIYKGVDYNFAYGDVQ
jgi:hypothetical protein